MKRILSTVLMFCMVLTIFPILPGQTMVYAAENWMWPTTKGAIITSTFGERWGRNHNGLDIAGTHGVSPIYATKSGTVVSSYSGCTCQHDYWTQSPYYNGNTCRHGKTLGNYVIINHGGGEYSTYMHLHWNGVVAPNTKVSQGDIIAYMGSTGRSNGTHLHFEVKLGATGAGDGYVTGGSYLNVNTDNVSYVYADGTSGSVVSPPVHTHTYKLEYEAKHPHKKYEICSDSSCKSKSYTGQKALVASCKECYPIGNVVLSRRVEKTKGKVIFQRENIVNANQYTIEVYKDKFLYGTYTMPKKEYTLTGLPSGTYYGILYAKNTSTGQEEKDRCDSFRILDTYAVNYNANGGSNAPSSQTKIEDTTLTLTTAKPTREGYIFKGWASSRNALEAQYQPGAKYTKNARITLYAVWEPEIYTVNYDVNGGVGNVASETVTYGNTIEMPNSVVKDSAYLKGWSTDKNATAVEYALGKKHKIKKNLTLYAVWGNATWEGEVSSALSGQGTQENPYLISTPADMAYLANKVNTQTAAPAYEYYKLMDNINMTYTEWIPIGVYNNTNQYFYGSFDGNGYTISDFYVSKANSGYVGLFGYAKNSEIKNLTLTGAMENLGASSVASAGGIVGYGVDTVLDGITVKYFNVGSISAGTAALSSVGVMAGRTSGGRITSCKVYDCTLSLKEGCFSAGMLVGNCSTEISDCQVEATQSGFFSSSATVGEICIGGLCGTLTKTAERCSVKAPYFSNNINGSGPSYIGGFVGYLDNEVKVCSVQFVDENKSSISTNGSGTLSLGGFAGYAGFGTKIQDCKFDGKTISGTTTGTSKVGGLVGHAVAKPAQTVSVTGGEFISPLKLPKKDGYTATWYSDAEQTMPYDFTANASKNTTIYASLEKTNASIWDGTSKEPAYNAETKTYTIQSGEELAWISDVSNNVIISGNNMPEDVTFSGYTIELASDIYLNNTSGFSDWSTTPPANHWKPIGGTNDGFAGTVKGNKFSVYGMYIQTTEDEIGLFGKLKGSISHLSVDKSYISGDGECGGIAGVLYQGTISYCSSNVTVVGDMSCGGIAGRASGTISYCYNTGNITGRACVGGIAGASSATVKYCYNDGTVTGIDAAVILRSENYGGIVGSSAGDISYCGNDGKITGARQTGGIAGENDEGTINYSYNTGTIMGTNAYAGGIAGKSYGNISYCYNKGSLAGSDDADGVGGIAGELEASVLSNCFNDGRIEGYDRVGGIVGYATTSISSSRLSDVKVRYAYNTGLIYARGDGEDYRGGIVGYADGNTSYSVYLTRCYQTSTTIPYVNVPDRFIQNVSSSSASMSTSEMKNLSNLTGFSTSYWETNSNINGGFPYLKSLKDSHSAYTITCVLDQSPAIDRAFVNVAGNVMGTAGATSYAGGIVGHGDGSSGSASNIKNVVTIADSAQAVTTGSGTAYGGNVIGQNQRSSFRFDNAYYDLDMQVTSSTNTLDTTGISRGKQSMNSTFYTTHLGLTSYESLEHLKTDEKAVWVIKSGELPELYYNCLCNIEISEEIENGSITVDKKQEIIGNKVTITATPNEGYVLNSLYVNGQEIIGNTFTVEAESEIYATFSEEIEEFNVAVSSVENATVTLINADSDQSVRLSNAASFSAYDGEEILVQATAQDAYTIDAIYVNDEEIAGESFILENDTTVRLAITSTSTKVDAITKDATNISDYYAVVGGSVSGEGEGVARYIRYWSAGDTETVYTTEVQSGEGSYSVELYDLDASTTYYYQMTEFGEIKSFTTAPKAEELIGGEWVEGSGDNPENPTQIPVTGVSLDIGNMKLSVGEKKILTVTVVPSNATNQFVSWRTSNPSVAIVKNGTVEAVGVGEAIIEVTTNDGGKTATCTVTVKKSAVTDTALSICSGAYNFDITCKQELTDGTLCVGLYGAGEELLDWTTVKTTGTTSYTANLPVYTDAKYAKVFLWGTIAGISPLAGVETITLQ